MEIRRRLHKDKWTIKTVTVKQMKKVNDGNEDAEGLCDIAAKTIYIREDHITYDTVAHEIFHAYWSYLYLDNTNNIEVLDVEEIGATFFAAQGEEMVRKAKSIFKKLKPEE